MTADIPRWPRRLRQRLSWSYTWCSIRRPSKASSIFLYLGRSASNSPAPPPIFMPGRPNGIVSSCGHSCGASVTVDGIMCSSLKQLFLPSVRVVLVKSKFLEKAGIVSCKSVLHSLKRFIYQSRVPALIDDTHTYIYLLLHYLIKLLSMVKLLITTPSPRKSI